MLYQNSNIHYFLETLWQCSIQNQNISHHKANSMDVHKQHRPNAVQQPTRNKKTRRAYVLQLSNQNRQQEEVE